MRIHFDGEPNRFAQMRALFSVENKLDVRYPTAKASKFLLLHDAQGQSLIRRQWDRLFPRRTA